MAESLPTFLVSWNIPQFSKWNTGIELCAFHASTLLTKPAQRRKKNVPHTPGTLARRFGQRKNTKFMCWARASQPLVIFWKRLSCEKMDLMRGVFYSKKLLHVASSFSFNRCGFRNKIGGPAPSTVYMLLFSSFPFRRVSCCRFVLPYFFLPVVVDLGSCFSMKKSAAVVGWNETDISNSKRASMCIY